MRFDVRHTTTFRYGAPVSESQNELRACPATDSRQQLLHYRVTMDPPARNHSYVDYWGTHVDTFGIRGQHDQLMVTAEATVETHGRDLTAVAAPMRALADPQFRDAHFEFLQASRRTRAHADAHDLARERVDLAGGDAVDAVLSINRWVAGNLEYRQGATFVGTTVEEVLDTGAGVCQDFAHVAVALCRAVGIPARYVSGYLFTEDDAAGGDTTSSEVVVQTHAWFEAAVPGAGWLALDPTNQQPVGQRHIVIGRGRDYDDVAPLRGTYVGAPTAELDVEVRLRRLAMAEQQQQQ